MGVMKMGKQSKRYRMTIKRNGETGYWESCKAKTLQGALVETTRRYKDYLQDSTIVVAERVEGQNRIIASRKLTDKKWTKKAED